MSYVRKIAVNSAWLFSGNVSARFLEFLTIPIITRLLGSKLFGTYEFIFMYLAIWSLLVDINVTSILVRENARDKDGAALRMGKGLSLCLCLSFIVIIISSLLFNFTKYPLEIKQLFYIAVFSVIVSTNINSIRRVFEGMFQSFLKMYIPAILNILDKFLFFGSVILIVVFDGTLKHIILARVISAVPGFILILVFYIKYFGKYT